MQGAPDGWRSPGLPVVLLPVGVDDDALDACFAALDACTPAGSYGSWYAALIDLSLRMSAHGWRNVLCDTAFVARPGEGRHADSDLDALAARWPGWHARLAQFLMHDPLHATRAQLTQLYADTAPATPQRELFA